MSGPFSPSSWMSVVRLTDIFSEEGERVGIREGGWVVNPVGTGRKEEENMIIAHVFSDRGSRVTNIKVACMTHL